MGGQEPTTRLGLIAGAGQFPLAVARAAKQQSLEVCAAAIQGWADPRLEQAVDHFAWIELGRLKQLLQWFRDRGVTTAIMAGKVTKEVLFQSGGAFDEEALAIVRRAPNMSVESLLGGVAQRLKQDGVTLVDSTVLLRRLLPEPGVLTRRAPTAAERQDIQLGRSVAQALARWDVGQTVIVRQGVVVAVEALEGTDAAIQRAGQLSPDGGFVVVKLAGERQDLRFDVPVVGPATIEAMTGARATCLAVEARKTLLLEQPAVVAAADRAGIAIEAVA